MNTGLTGAVPRNIAVVGCGYWGRNLVRNFAGLGALHTICDRDARIVKELGNEYPGVGSSTDYGEVLTSHDIAGVAISTPAASHYDMARQALEAGKDVFVEKPLSLSLPEGGELVDIAERTGRVLMVGHLLEYHPAIVKLKELVDAGELGKINYIYSSRLNLGKFRTEENILWSFAPHDISVILLLLGEMPQQVAAHGGQYLNRDITDITVTTLSFGGGTRAHIFVSWLHPYKEQKLVVIGDKKMAVFDDMNPECKLALYEDCIEWRNRLPVPNKKQTVPVEFVMEEPLRLECRHFLDCMASRQKPRTGGDKGLQVLRVLDACQRSLQGDGSVISLDDCGYYVHPTTIVEHPVSIGEGTRIWHFGHVMPGAVIGRNCNIGQNVFVAGNVRVGNNVKIQNNVSIYEGVTLEDDVFCGPSCVFTNVAVPRSHISQRGNYTPTVVGKGATIGANATIVCGNNIGRYAFVGAGAVVTRDVADYALVYGNPARVQGWVCACGARLYFNGEGVAVCPACGQRYIRKDIEGEARIERDSDADSTD